MSSNHEWYLKNKEMHNKRTAKRKEERVNINPGYKVSCYLSRSMREVIKRHKIIRWKWQAILGYSVSDLKAHLEKLFTDQMSWDNHGTYWSIDHVTPISYYKYPLPSDHNFKVCWALQNLQPYPLLENKKKYNNLKNLQEN